jgi:60 kDa SS-A/Ro ribonucleoprotein
MKTVSKASGDYRVDKKEPRLAGGYGPYPAKQNPEALLRRAVLSCLLWENLFYESGLDNAYNIADLIPQVNPETCVEIAIEARNEQKLRHVPLYIARVMAGLDTHKSYVGSLLPQIIQRADELAEFLAIYWKEEKQPLSKQIKLGLAQSFNKFNEYQFAKYRGEGKDIKLRDVLQLVHPKPNSMEQSLLYRKILDNTLETPDTWEVALSTGKNKKETWERLITEKKLGALAFLRNLRNMEEENVSHDVIVFGFETINPKWLLPLNYLSAAKYAPRWEKEIETLMFKSFELVQKLPGYTIFVVDVSGSMGSGISEKSTVTRLDVANAMAMFASELCEKVSVYITAGNDSTRVHKTKLVAPRKGFGLIEKIEQEKYDVGGGGIFTRQCLEYIKEQELGKIPDRIIVFSDSQDCDNPNKRIPNPFGKNNYIIDVSSHQHGINYDGIWDAEISGWSEHFIPYIACLEGINLQSEEE